MMMHSPKHAHPVVTVPHGVTVSTALRKPTLGARPLDSTPFLVGLLLLSAPLWILALSETHVLPLNGYGLVARLPIVWYIALVVVGFVIVVSATSVSAPRSLFACAAFLIVLYVHATPSLLYPLPRYTWTYKHIGVVNAISLLHASPRSVDIYFNWPGFFTFAGLISKTSGLSLNTIAAWTPPVFELGYATAAYLLFKSLSNNEIGARVATGLFLLANWVGQDYFSPQGLGFFLYLTFLGVYIRADKVRIWSDATRISVGRTADARAYLPLSLLWLSILVTHQLTPVMLISSLICLSLAGQMFDIVWLLGAVTSEIIWVVLAYPYLHKHGFQLISSNLSSSSRPPYYNNVRALAGLALRAGAVNVMYFGLFALAALTVLARLRRRRTSDLRPAALAFAPVLLLALRSYGGEAKLRTYLFSAPFLCLIIAGELTESSFRSTLRLTATYGAYVLVGGLFLLCYFGQEKVNYVAQGDVAATRWFYRNAPTSSLLTYVAPSFPSRLVGNYVDYPPVSGDVDPNLLSDSEFAKTHSATAAIDYLSHGKATKYLMLTPSERNYLVYFGIMSESEVDSLSQALSRSSSMQVVYSGGGATVWRVVSLHI